MGAAAERAGEIVEATSCDFTAQSMRLHDAPPFGSLVRVPHDDRELYGIVAETRTASLEAGGRPIARGYGEVVDAAIYHENPDLEHLLRTSDFISLHAPLYAETRHVINAESLKLVKPTCYLINAARGPLVDTNALMDALEEGRLAGAALDVTDPEPLPANHPILELDNVIVTCHTAANSNESYIACQSHAAREVVRVLKGQAPSTPITDPWLLAEAADQGFGGV